MQLERESACSLKSNLHIGDFKKKKKRNLISLKKSNKIE